MWGNKVNKKNKLFLDRKQITHHFVTFSLVSRKAMSAETSKEDHVSLLHYPSTVFLCDTTPDARYIRCDFRHCSKHTLNNIQKCTLDAPKLPTDYWMLNTEKNVATLERHVSSEIYNFMMTIEDGRETQQGELISEIGTEKRLEYELNTHLLCKETDLESYKRVLVVFNLRDPQSTFGRWVDYFLCAVKEEDNIEVPYLCVTLSFSSRKELLQQVSRLHNLTKATHLEVAVVLSCHSSAQGQVFSCTPTALSKLYNFEEFCSVHDFVVACQDVLKSQLKWIHLSSCYAMKLNASHQEWPVDSSWYATDLKCIVSGSAKEVYETGSQTADLFFVLNTILLPTNLQLQFITVFQEASLNLFPDLVKEMGLTMAGPMNCNVVEAKLKDPDREDNVTKPKVIDSNVHLVILYSPLSYALKQALYCNLKARTTCDVKTGITSIEIDPEHGTCFEQINNTLRITPLPSSKSMFFLVLKNSFESIDIINAVTKCEINNPIYGVHIAKVNEQQILHLKNGFPSLKFSVTGFVEKSVVVSSKYFCPVMLYLVHLVLGENGHTQDCRDSLSVPSKWSLEEVFKETRCVLPGLCELSNLTLIMHSHEKVMTKPQIGGTAAEIGEVPKTCSTPSFHSSADAKMSPMCNQYGSKPTVKLREIVLAQSSQPNADKKYSFRKSTVDMKDFTGVYAEAEEKNFCGDIGAAGDDVEKNSVKVENKNVSLENPIIRMPSSQVLSHETANLETNFQRLSRQKVEQLELNRTNASDNQFTSLKSRRNLSSVRRTSPSDGMKSTPQSDILFVVETDENGKQKVFQKNLHCNKGRLMSKDGVKNQNNESVQQPTKQVRLKVPSKHGRCFKQGRNPPTLFPIYPQMRNGSNRNDPQDVKDIPSLMRLPPPQMKSAALTRPENDNNDLIKRVRDALPVFNEERSTWEHIGVGEKKSTSSPLGIFDANLKDVPLMANVDEVLVYHYNLDLDVNFEEKQIDGNILLFLRPANEDVLNKDFQMCLDCTLIDIESVHEITIPDDHEIHFHNNSCCCTKYGDSDSTTDSICKSCALLRTYQDHIGSGLKYQTLSYSVFGWCIRIWKDTAAWPRCVYIKYRTKPVGPSLMWSRDLDGNPCAFTPGAYINNRSMMPCQEPPVAMSTWSASINVPKDFVVLSSGDKVECRQKYINSEDTNTYCFEMSMPLPSSTLAFAFGKFACSSQVIPVLYETNKNVIPVSLYASQSKIASFEQEYLELSAKYLKSACTILGEFPFSRVDLVVLPKSFACLGLQSPNITFLSQSILCGDQSMSTRIAHEISHAWFGLLVGAEDWTEEWLSEGFATYIEDRILAHGQGMNEAQFANYSQLMQVIRFKTLKGELEHTDDDNLKRLRPKKIKNYRTAVDAANDSSLTDNKGEGEYTTVPNGAVSSKKWSQVHYLKGYFLLLYMAKLVGLQSFDAFLKHYLETYAGRLVTSEMFFNLYVGYYTFPMQMKDDIISQWMESTDLPLSSFASSVENELVVMVDQETKFWNSNNTTNKRFKTSGEIDFIAFLDPLLGSYVTSSVRQSVCP